MKKILSGFFHTGINSLIDVVSNRSNVTIVIVDNRITPMTGAQQNPGSGVTLQQQPARPIVLEELVRSLGVERVRVLDPYDPAGTLAALKEEAAFEGPSVLISQGPCVQTTKADLDTAACTGCGLCMRLGCPAIGEAEPIEVEEGKKPRRSAAVDPLLVQGLRPVRPGMRLGSDDPPDVLVGRKEQITVEMTSQLG